MRKQYLYQFSQGNKDMEAILSSKGAQLCEMDSLGIPVPKGFILSTDAFSVFKEHHETLPTFLLEEIFATLSLLEKSTGKIFGDTHNPLFLSIRSGCRVSMPGAMDTILNVGINDTIVEAIYSQDENSFFAYDIYRRFIQMYADVVKHHPMMGYEKIYSEILAEALLTTCQATHVALGRELVQKLKAHYLLLQGSEFPQDPKQQLLDCIGAVLKSWDNPRAETYRRKNQISYHWGTAVIFQEMVFGNRNLHSASGIVFSRNPSTGKNMLTGEYLLRAQGEDMVNAIGKPSPFTQLKAEMPSVYKQLSTIVKKLELHYKDMQDIEFTIENETLYLLQTRNGKRTADASYKIAVDLVKEEIISKNQALLLINTNLLDQLFISHFQKKALNQVVPIAHGFSGSPGAVSGHIVFSSTDLHTKPYTKTILICNEINPKYISSLFSLSGIISSTGGIANHTAILARSLHVPCIFGLQELSVNPERTRCTIGNKVFHEGDLISIDGTTGDIYYGEIPLEKETVPKDFLTLMQWADEVHQMKVFINANTPAEITQGLKLGADGIGLCRTEHMFFEENRSQAMQELLVSIDAVTRKKALDKIFPYQLADFIELFSAAQDAPLVIRFLDPFLQEFLPSDDEEMQRTAENIGISPSYLRRVTQSLQHISPLMKNSGLRLAMFYPEIVEMQTIAILQAALIVQKKIGKKIIPRFLIPQVGELNELLYVKKHLKSTADSVLDQAGSDMHYRIGCMIEIPRACILSEELAKEVDFFNFGTNNLTQLVFGFNNTEANDLLELYYQKKIFEFNPFEHIDVPGVGKLLSTSAKVGRRSNPLLVLGISGRHTRDAHSIQFFHDAGMNFISCPNFSVPMAKFACAQAAILRPREDFIFL